MVESSKAIPGLAMSPLPSRHGDGCRIDQVRRRSMPPPPSVPLLASAALSRASAPNPPPSTVRAIRRNPLTLDQRNALTMEQLNALMFTQPEKLKRRSKMATPSEKLARSLAALRAIQERGTVAIRTADLARTDRERLVRNGCLQPVMKGWYIARAPGTAAGDTTGRGTAVPRSLPRCRVPGTCARAGFLRNSMRSRFWRAPGRKGNPHPGQSSCRVAVTWAGRSRIARLP